MDLKALLEKFDQFAGQAVGQKPGDQVRGTEKAKSTKSGKDHPFKGRLVGASESIIKDLSKGATPKTKEQELAEEWAVFSEEDLGTYPKRAGRKSDRHARGHEPQPRYKTVKANEGWNTGSDRVSLPDSPHTYWSGTGPLQKEYDELYAKLVPSQGAADTIEGEVLRAASKIVYRHYNDGDEFNEASFDQLEQYIGKVTSYDDLAHKSTEFAVKANGNYTPNNGWDSLDVMDYGPPEDDYDDEEEDDWYDDEDDLEEAANPAQQAAIAIAMKKAGKKPKNEGVAYKATNPHPASKDPIVAKVLKQMRPGLTGIDMNNEAFLYFAYEIGKMRAREMWEDYGPAIKYFYQSGIGVNEGWESGPEEYEEPYDDADDAYDRQRQEKIDAEAEAEWNKKPKKTTYKLSGRGPNMEPNYEFGDEFDDLDAAKEYRRKLMADPKTPHPEHIGIRTINRIIDENSVTVPQNKAHADQMMRDLTKLQTDVPNPDPELAATIARRKDILMKQAKELGIDESRAHKILNTWFKNRELADKFAKGEVKVPTPQERKAELEKPKKQVKEYGATGTASASSTVNQPTIPTTKSIATPDDVKKSMAATTAVKAATGSTAPATNLMKAIDSASQGKAADAQTMKALEPTLDVIQTAFQNPTLANQFKTLAQQSKQVK